MSERYYITGVQLGMLKTFSQTHMPKKANELIDEIIDKQFIGNIDTSWKLDLNDISSTQSESKDTNSELKEVMQKDYDLKGKKEVTE